jgi:hypothetical protein
MIADSIRNQTKQIFQMNNPSIALKLPQRVVYFIEKNTDNFDSYAFRRKNNATF